MGNLASTIPFTELWERLLTMARIDSPNNEDFARGIINDVYSRTLPRLKDWEPLVSEDNLSMTASYNTGTIAATAGGTTVTGTGTTWTSGMTATDGYRIKIGGNDNVYLRPNGIALGGNFSGNQTNFSAATVQGSALAGFWLANVPAGNPDWPTMTEARFDAARTLAGLARRRQYGARLDGWNQIFLVIGVWNETATNVTSLLVAADSGSIGAGSVLTLYKTIP